MEDVNRGLTIYHAVDTENTAALLYVFGLSPPFHITPPSPQPPFVPCGGVLSPAAEQGDDVTVLNGCQEEYRSSSAKAQNTHTHKHTHP